MTRRSSRKRPAHRHAFPPEPTRGVSVWRWFGLGALGIAAAALMRGERRTRTRKPQTADLPPVTPPAIFEPPEDTLTSWLPGPSASIRILERNPDGQLCILFVHGPGGCADQWSAQFAAAGPGLRTLALDLPGHGGSDPAADGDYSIATAAAAIAAVADSLRLRRVVLVGHGLGALAAIEYADSHPYRVAGLLLVDPSGDQTRLPAKQKRQFLDQLRRDPKEELDWYFRQLLSDARPEVVDRVIQQLATVPAEVCSSFFSSALDYSPVAALERLTEPVRSVISDRNTLPYSLHNLVTSLPVSRLGSANHWMMMDRPEELWAVLVDFLDEVVAHHPA